MTRLARFATAAIALSSILVFGNAASAGATETIPARVGIIPAQAPPADAGTSGGAADLLIVGGAVLLGIGAVTVATPAAPRRRCQAPSRRLVPAFA